MKIPAKVIRVAILGLVLVFRQRGLFLRIKDEILRTTAAMPNTTGAEKREVVVADCKSIFNDRVKPVAEQVIRRLLELALAYIEA